MTASVNIQTTTPAPDAEVIGAISERIRRRRREQRLSLGQLASRSGVSKGMLVQLERGATNPSISTLCKVAAALGCSIADLVDAAGPSPAHVVPATPRVLWKGPRGGSATLLAGSRGPDMLELWTWDLRPGERYDAIAHPAGTRELLHVTHGRLALSVDGVDYLITTGHAVGAETDRPHAYACAGGRPVRFLMVVMEQHA